MSEERSTARDDVLLDARELAVEFVTRDGVVRAVRDVSVSIRRGETLGLVGESGSGKSVTSLALMGSVPPAAFLVGGTVRWRGQELDARGLRGLRGSRVTLINQNPLSSLNPLKAVGDQVAEVLRRHRGLSRPAARRRAVELFDQVGIPDPVRRARQYPFEFSGGMAQRVVIALALAPEPELLIADEPTTALDVTVQADILDLISELQASLGIAVLLVTHDLGVVAGQAERVAVMYAGRIVEEGRAADVFAHPSHPYTQGLLDSIPHPFRVRRRLESIAGSPPVPGEVADGCAFAPRCTRATDLCRRDDPALVPTDSDPSRSVACWHAL